MNKKGFTFIELSMVLLILSIFMAVAIPRFSLLFGSGNIDGGASRLSSYIRHIKDLSTYKGQSMALHCDISKGVFSVLGKDGDKISDVMLRPLKLPQRVFIAEVKTKKRGTVSTGTTDIWFYPGGMSDEAFIHLTDESKREITLEIPIIGRKVNIYEGFAEKT